MTSDTKRLLRGIHSVEDKGWQYNFYNDGKEFVLRVCSTVKQRGGYYITGEPIRFKDFSGLLSYLLKRTSLTIEKLLFIIE